MVTEKNFGTLPDGEVKCFHLENASGAYAEVLSFGAVVTKLCVPDRQGNLTDVVLGYDTLEGYMKNGCFFGACIGRSGNRIEGGRFKLDGQEVVLTQNEGNNNLHSGPDGFEKKLWTAKHIDQENNSVTFSRISPDGENGFPGEFDISVTYEFTENNALRIVYTGVCDQTTVANMTNHSYFNLAGEGSGNVLDQYLTIHAQSYTPVREDSIPLGENVPVEGTPMDFRKEKQIGKDIEADFEQLRFTGGFDHNYVTDGYTQAEIREIACARCEETGVVMEVLSDCPCVQFYAGNFVEQENGKNGHIYDKRDGFCLETQVEPNAVNVEEFHSPVLEKGERYYSETVYRFSVRD
ncbi:aldose epimerase family protein [Blautia sp. XA-2221]|uniref:aldose epimerase family protein n=1 Tax=Blautia sp. XA-2221 TaxID=2903961 RepID=UPI00237824F4|nr:aldose epimerase family protein [Blautia sp. XA-2221]